MKSSNKRGQSAIRWRPPNPWRAVNMRTKRNWATTVIAVILLCQAAAALGEVTKTFFLGVITNISDGSSAALGSIAIGQTVSGYFTFSDDPTNHIGEDQYRATTAISLPEVNFIIDAETTYIRVRDNRDQDLDGIVDYFGHGYDSIGPLPETAPYYIYELDMEFFDRSAQLFTTNPALPYVPRVSDFDDCTWSLFGKRTDTDQPFYVSGKIVLTTATDGPPWILDSNFTIASTASIPQLGWATTPGLSANVFFTTNLLNGFWQPFDSIPANDGTNTTLAVPATNQTEYFRIIYTLD